ncbi:Hydroxylysine kinase [Penaeus vannamei]|uniref:Hydroxylysine kinase n=1 Tax=Penaeus vannamei TaxID=6689 RepID=A0A423TRD7_PENVA|nr:Hydroxylysine kinase [Penaeus vannamei]
MALLPSYRLSPLSWRHLSVTDHSCHPSVTDHSVTLLSQITPVTPLSQITPVTLPSQITPVTLPSQITPVTLPSQITPATLLHPLHPAAHSYFLLYHILHPFSTADPTQPTLHSPVLQLAMSSMPEASDAHGLLQPGQIIRPMLKKADVPALVGKLYGLTVVSVKELNSYDDKNYLIQVQSKVNNPHMTDLCPHGYVVKVTNSLDSKNIHLMAAQNDMMLFLHSRGINVPKPEKNVHGTYMVKEKMEIFLSKGDKYFQDLIL